MIGEYILNFSDNSVKPPLVVQPRALNTDTTLNLYGRGAASYGEAIQENMLRLLENSCSPTPPPRATLGQFWYSNITKTVAVCTSVAPLVWTEVNIITAASSPTTTVIGTMWFNTTAATLNFWSGSAWVEIASADGVKIVLSTTEPPVGAAGKLWLDPSNNQMHYSDGAIFHDYGINMDESAYVRTLVGLLPENAVHLTNITSNVQTQLSDLVLETDNLQLEKLSLSGGALSGFLALHADPLLSMQAANKRYVDNAIFNAIAALTGTNGGYYQHIVERTATVDGQTDFDIDSSNAPIDNTTRAANVYVSGILQADTAYSFTGSVLSLTVGVAEGTTVMVDIYQLGTTPGLISISRNTQATISGTTVYTVPTYVMGANTLLVFIDGVKQYMGVSYTETSATSITLLSPVVTGKELTTIAYDRSGTATIDRNALASAAFNQTVYATLPYYFTTNGSDIHNVGIMVYAGGVAQTSRSCSKTSGTSIALAPGIAAGTPVEVYVYNISPV